MKIDRNVLWLCFICPICGKLYQLHNQRAEGWREVPVPDFCSSQVCQGNYSQWNSSESNRAGGVHSGLGLSLSQMDSLEEVLGSSKYVDSCFSGKSEPRSVLTLWAPIIGRVLASREILCVCVLNLTTKGLWALEAAANI